MIAKSTVSEVQIYRNSASVIRNGEITLKEGRNIVYIGGMTTTAKTEDFVLQFPENIKAVNVRSYHGTIWTLTKLKNRKKYRRRSQK